MNAATIYQNLSDLVNLDGVTKVAQIDGTNDLRYCESMLGGLITRYTRRLALDHLGVNPVIV